LRVKKVEKGKNELCEDFEKITQELQENIRIVGENNIQLKKKIRTKKEILRLIKLKLIKILMNIKMNPEYIKTN
jgi:hypothetical protein